MNDLISRATAIDDLHGKDPSQIWDTADIEVWVNALPSAQSERIKGRWIEIALSNHTYKCSVCGRLLVNITDGKNNVAKNYPYCHCGADMRGEQDEREMTGTENVDSDGIPIAWMPLPKPYKEDDHEID